MMSIHAVRLLVVSGDYAVLQRTREAFDPESMQITSAFSHRDLLYMLDTEFFDLALVDSAMYDRESGEATYQLLSRRLPTMIFARENWVADCEAFIIGALTPRTLQLAVQTVLADVEPQDESQEMEQVETLISLGKSLTEVLDLSEVLNRIVTAAWNLTKAEEGMLLMPDDDDEGRLYLRARVGIDDDVAKNFRIKTEDSVAGQVLREGKAQRVGHQGLQKVKTQYFVKALLYVPIILKNKPIGVLGVNNKFSETSFTPNQEELLRNLASYAAIAIENARIHEESVRRALELQSLVDASHIFNSSLSLAQTLPNIGRHLVQLLDVSWSEIYRWDHESNSLHRLARYQQSLWRANSGPVVDLEQRPLLRAAMQEQRPASVRMRDASAGVEQAYLKRLAVERMMFLPIVTDNQSLGAVRLFWVQGGSENRLAPDVLSRVQRLGLEALVMLMQTNVWRQGIQLFRKAEEINALTGADWCEFATVSGKSRLVIQVAVGVGVWPEAPYPEIDINRFTDLADVLAYGRPFHKQRDPYHEGPQALLDYMYSESLLGLPLIQRGQVSGLVLFGDTRYQREFNERDLNLGKAIVGQAATALENASLFHDLQRSVKDLREAQDILVQTARLAAMGELAAAVAHQINNPLTTILVDTELMLSDETPNTPNYESLTAILRAGKRAASVVRRLLAAARPNFYEDATPEPVDVVETIEGTLSLVNSHIRQNGIRINAHLPETPLPRIMAVPGQLDDIWLNLLLNAHDALIEHQTPAPEIGVEVKHILSDGCIDVRIWDNGPGIPEVILAEIFKPFFTTKPIGQGTGLGLHISRQVVERVGGEIRIQPSESGGACFFVRLPVNKDKK
jgi:signal transduction histidine kinase/putative methionine-R-sulfoxide reductase with GAF domain